MSGFGDDPPATAGGAARAPSPPTWSESDCLGHPVRHFPLAVSAGALALGWARQEEAPSGATVVVDREISALGRIGRVWPQEPEHTLACAVVLRPPLAAEEADTVWLLASLAAAEAAEATAGGAMGTWWPDDVVSVETGELMATVKAEVQLGPGRVRSAVATFRFDLARLDVDDDDRDALLEAVLVSLDGRTANPADDEPGAKGLAVALASDYQQSCRLLGRRVKIALLPKGSTRGTAARVDRLGRLELESSTGMVERVGINQLRSLEVV